MEKKLIYADNAATTAVSERVLKAMLPYMSEKFGNPSSVYGLGREAARAVSEAREKIAAALHCQPSEIYFTSGGTEADNWAIYSCVSALSKNHIVTDAAEHPAVLRCCEQVEKLGGRVTYLPVDGECRVSTEQVWEAICPDTAVVSVMYANNEVGTVMPIEETAAVCREKGTLFHTDAVQAVGNVPIDLSKLDDIDMLSCSGHKLRAPKGTGFLYVHRYTSLASFISGGGQERGRRAGTENVPGIVGLGEAVAAACEDIPKKAARISEVRDRLISGLLKIPGSRLNGSRKNRLCGNVNISFTGIEGESLLLLLDSKGICASSGSACSSGTDKPSHVLLAMGLDEGAARGSLRLTIDESFTEEDAEYVVKTVGECVERLRRITGTGNA